MRSSLLILGYHDFDTDERNPWTLDPMRLAEHIGLLRRRGYQFVALDQARKALRVEGQKSVCLTFDDGRAGCYHYARRILAAAGIQGVFYICPGMQDADVAPSEKYSKFMTWSEVRDLAAEGHTIGAHSMDHRGMVGMTRQALWRQFYGSRAVLHKRLGIWCEHFAVPYGLYNSEIMEYAQMAGYSTLVTTDLGLNHVGQEAFRLLRYQVTSRGAGSNFEEIITQLEATCET